MEKTKAVLTCWVLTFFGWAALSGLHFIRKEDVDLWVYFLVWVVSAGYSINHYFIDKYNSNK